MTTTQRCDLTDLLVDQCAHCKKQLSVEEEVAAERSQRAADVTGWIEAQYPGACCRCGERIAIGDLITLSSPYRSVGWIGTCCAPEPEVSR